MRPDHVDDHDQDRECRHGQPRSDGEPLVRRHRGASAWQWPPAWAIWCSTWSTGWFTRLRIRPGKRPKSSVSATSGVSVSSSTRLMSVRWWPRPFRKSVTSPKTTRWIHPHQVGGAEDHDDRGDGGGDRPVHERAEEDQELADEAGQARQAELRQHEEAEDRRRRPASDRASPPILAIVPVVGPLVDHADAEEERARDDPVVDHLEHGALQALLLEDEDAQRHEAHVADRAVGDQLLEVGLHHRHDRAVDDRDQRQHDHQSGQVAAPRPGRAAGRSGSSRSRPASAARRPGSPSRPSAPPRARRAARCGTATSAP